LLSPNLYQIREKEMIMSNEENFLNALLSESETKEEEQTEAYFDLLLLQIQQLQSKIEHTFSEAEKEVKIINQWALSKNHALQVRIEWMEKKLEAFIRERKAKTIELSHGILKCHKKPDKVEITDMDVFLANAKPELLTVTEQIKPNMVKIKDFMSMSYKGLPGVTIIKVKDEFSYTITKIKEDEDVRSEKTGTATQPALLHRVAL